MNPALRRRLFVPLLALAAALAAADAPDTPDAVRAERRAAIEKDYADTRLRAAEHALEQARLMQAKARKSGNVTAQAVARTAVRIATDARDALARGAEPALPETVRRELADWAAELRRRLDSAADTRDAALAALGPDGSDGSDKSDRSDGSDRSDKSDRSDRSDGSDPSDPSDPSDSSDAPATASGEAAAWTPLAHVSIVVSALDVLDIPVAGAAKPARIAGGNPAAGQEHAIEWKPVHELVVGDTLPVFRAVPEGDRPVDVVAWPSPRNGWTLELRARPGPDPSRPLRFRLDVADGTAHLRPLDGAEAADPAEAAPAIPVRFESDPPGATVLLDGALLSERGRALRTPFDASIPPDEIREVRFRKRGCLDSAYRGVTPRPGTFRATLRPDPAHIDRTLSIRANRPGWQTSRIPLKKGETVILSATGAWQCGGDTPVDALGYPNDDRFFAFYLDPKAYPRIVPAENFGCLLARIGPDGEIVPFRSLRIPFTADADGILVFAPNEAPETRRDNRGTLDVRVTSAP